MIFVCSVVCRPVKGYGELLWPNNGIRNYEKYFSSKWHRLDFYNRNDCAQRMFRGNHGIEMDTAPFFVFRSSKVESRDFGYIILCYDIFHGRLVQLVGKARSAYVIFG